MIAAVFERKNGRLCSVSVTGHAGYADAGKDIVCASVSSAMQLTANLITEEFREKAKITVEDNAICIRLRERYGNGSTVLNGFYAHLQCLSEDYPGTIQVEIMEV